ncbi:uncharacterized protein LOC132631833 isoform X2 [Lycium barbarum]|uniref:uncharacterized protein LOC132631833 isoform X2 n=1 Tax=Lycium barbarum TaxID=112863 RepID=UPI00293F077A|nr:uncharacterized protein LOC132631833 isoform X2 [Lycium barbarum]
MNRNAYTWKMLTLIGRRHVLSVGGSIQKILPPTSNRILLKVCISILDRIHDKEGRSSLSTKVLERGFGIYKDLISTPSMCSWSLRYCL